MSAVDVEETERELVGRRRRGRSASVESSGRHTATASDSDGSQEGEDDDGGGWGLDAVYNQLVHECRLNQPGETLGAHTRARIERLAPCERVALVSRLRGGCAPLFVACAQGNRAIAEYLLQVCGANIEQRGLYRARAERTKHRVTPLWVAAVTGQLEMVRALAKAGACVDARSDSGSSPLRSACFMSHVEVARCLVALGADVSAANHHGGTCLVNAVQSPALCRLLLDAGADVNAQDAQLKTALHYAIQEHREDTTRVLLRAGADPALESRAGDDALQTACIKGSTRLVHLLLAVSSYSRARTADAYELLGATQLDEFNNASAALASWRAATAIRHGASDGTVVPKRGARGPLPALGGAREWSTPQELSVSAHDPEWLWTQALLVVVRVLGPTHKDTLLRLMYRGAAYAEGRRYSRCLALWSWVLDIRVRRDTLLHQETHQTLVAVTRLLVEARSPPPPAEDAVPLAALHVLRLVARDMPECRRLVSLRPAHRAHRLVWDRTVRCVPHLVLAALRLPRPDMQALLRDEVSALVRGAVAVTTSDDSLLHLACTRLRLVPTTYFPDDEPAEPLFPSVGVARLLVQCGADVQSRNRARCTPLHVAATPDNFSTELVETLVSLGAHLDQPSPGGESPAEVVARNPASRVFPLRHVTLACRAARVLARHAPAARRVPPALRPFLELHRA